MTAGGTAICSSLSKKNVREQALFKPPHAKAEVLAPEDQPVGMLVISVKQLLDYPFVKVLNCFGGPRMHSNSEKYCEQNRAVQVGRIDN